MLAGIRDVLMISTPQDTPRFEALLGDGSRWGMNLSYCVQPSPDGLAQAFILGRGFVGSQPSALVLGDNIFYGHDFAPLLQRAERAHRRRDDLRLPRDRPRALWRGGVRRSGSAPSRSRKSRKRPKSNYAVTGLYFYDRAGLRHRGQHQAERARRTRDHRGQCPLPAAGPARRRDHGPRLCLARHRHARQPARGGTVHRDAREAAGPEGRLPRGDRLPLGLDRRRAARGAGRADAQERLRPVPAAPAAARRAF